jgi:hypothetical protein
MRWNSTPQFNTKASRAYTIDLVSMQSGSHIKTCSSHSVRNDGLAAKDQKKRIKFAYVESNTAADGKVVLWWAYTT